MSVDEPGTLIQQFARYFNAGDLDGMGSLYESDAVITPEPGGAAISGIPAIQEALRAFMAIGGTLTIVATTSVRCGDVALTHSSWRIAPPGADPIEAVSAEVVRLQADGSWRYVIDNPWGGALLVQTAQQAPA